MAKIISFLEKKREKEEKFGLDKDFNALLQEAVKLKRQEIISQHGELVFLKKGFQEFLQNKISSFLLKNRLINPDLFCCGLYVSKVMFDFLSKPFLSYYVVDYYVLAQEKEDVDLLRQGGDFCYLVLVFFKNLARRRGRSLQYFQQAGENFYYSYYEGSGKVIGWCMSNNFLDMVKIGRRCWRGI